MEIRKSGGNKSDRWDTLFWVGASSLRLFVGFRLRPTQVCQKANASESCEICAMHCAPHNDQFYTPSLLECKEIRGRCSTVVCLSDNDLAVTSQLLLGKFSALKRPFSISSTTISSNKRRPLADAFTASGVSQRIVIRVFKPSRDNLFSIFSVVYFVLRSPQADSR